MQLVELDGASGWDLGRAYGEAVAPVVPALWSAYVTVFDRLSKVSEARALEMGAASLGLVQAWRPSLVEEMEGVAAGAGVPVEAVAALNARSEIVVAAECTTIGRVGPAGGPWLAQNWDWFGDVPQRCVVVVRPGFTTFTEAGILAKVGLNTAGLALTLNMLSHESDRREPIGIPAHLLIREILGSCGSVADVVALVASVRVSASFCLTVLSRNGAAAMLEITPAGFACLEPGDDGFLAHANVFEAPELAAGDRGVDRGASAIRLATARRQRPRRLEEAKDLLAAHADVGSICRHDEPQPLGLPSGGTIATVLLDLGAATMHVGHGPPCQAAFETVGVGQKLLGL